MTIFVNSAYCTGTANFPTTIIVAENKTDEANGNEINPRLYGEGLYADANTDTHADDEIWEEEWNDTDGSTETTEDGFADEWADDTGDSKEKEEDEDRYELMGEFRNKLAFDLDEENDIEDDIANHAELLVGVKAVMDNRMHAVASLNVNYFSYGNDGDWDNDDTIRLHDAYINLRGNGFNLRLGNQITRWGKTDGYSPLDNLNPEDLRDNLSGRREDRKLPIPMANLEIYTGPVTISGVFIPVFVKPEFDILGTDWALLGHADQMGRLAVIEDDPSKSLKNSEGGIRFSGIAGNLDWAISWLHTWEDIPTPDTLTIPAGVSFPAGDLSISQLADFSRATGQPVFLTHDRQNIFGFEFETTLSSFGLRGDIAYIDNSSFFTRDLQRIRKSVLHAMIGIDYNGEADWYANIQFFQSFIGNHENRMIWAEETTSAINGTLRKEFSNGDIDVECRFYYDLSGNASTLNPKVRLSFWEPIIFEIGGEWFDGSNQTVLGRFDDNDQLYMSVEIKF